LLHDYIGVKHLKVTVAPNVSDMTLSIDFVCCLTAAVRNKMSYGVYFMALVSLSIALWCRVSLYLVHWPPTHPEIPET